MPIRLTEEAFSVQVDVAKPALYAAYIAKLDDSGDPDPLTDAVSKIPEMGSFADPMSDEEVLAEVRLLDSDTSKEQLALAAVGLILKVATIAAKGSI